MIGLKSGIESVLACGHCFDVSFLPNQWRGNSFYNILYGRAYNPCSDKLRYQAGGPPKRESYLWMRDIMLLPKGPRIWPLE